MYMYESVLMRESWPTSPLFDARVYSQLRNQMWWCRRGYLGRFTFFLPLRCDFRMFIYAVQGCILFLSAIHACLIREFLCIHQRPYLSDIIRVLISHVCSTPIKYQWLLIRRSFAQSPTGCETWLSTRLPAEAVYAKSALLSLRLPRLHRPTINRFQMLWDRFLHHTS